MNKNDDLVSTLKKLESIENKPTHVLLKLSNIFLDISNMVYDWYTLSTSGIKIKPRKIVDSTNFKLQRRIDSLEDDNKYAQNKQLKLIEKITELTEKITELTEYQHSKENQE